MTILTRVVLTLSLCVFALGCGGKDSPTGPTSTTPTVPNYAGGWSGRYTITSCTQTGGVALANLCGGLTGSAPFRMNLSQTDRAITGQFFLGEIGPFQVATTVTAAGGLAFTGSTTSTGGLSIAADWIVASPLVGTMTETWTLVGVSGQAQFNTTIASATR